MTSNAPNGSSTSPDITRAPISFLFWSTKPQCHPWNFCPKILPSRDRDGSLLFRRALGGGFGVRACFDPELSRSPNPRCRRPADQRRIPSRQRRLWLARGGIFDFLRTRLPLCRLVPRPGRRRPGYGLGG